MTRYGFDLHGVIDKEVEFYLFYLEYLIAGDANFEPREVWIISGPPAEEIKAELTKLGFEQGKHYTQICSVVDYLKEKGVKMWLGPKGTWFADDEDWWSSKAEICKKYEIDVHFDDTGRYAAYFTDPRYRFELI